MKKKIIATILLTLSMGLGFSSCEDMLTGDMDRHVEVDEIAQDTLYSYWGILRSLQNIAERYVILGECRGDLVDGTQYVSDSINSILEFGLMGNATDGSNRYLKAADFYHVINSCNAYIYRCDTAAVSGLNKPLMLSEYAQVVSIRAWAYLQLVLAYGRVPYFEQPLLSTADMEDFHRAEQYVDANTLASSGAVRLLEEVRYIPAQLRSEYDRVIPYPDYDYYGRTRRIAYASQCIFPQDLVLADIYLLRAQGEGTEADYRLAAQHYYNFLNSDKGGPLLPNSLYGRQRKDMGTEEYFLTSNLWTSMFYNDVEPTGTGSELVTVIPSSTNKLWGTVLRGINELFGFDATLSVRTSTQDTTTTTTASVSLERNFQHQLNCSAAYRDLNKAQDYEAYIGPSGATNCTVLAGAGDTRYKMSTSNYTDYEKGSNEEENFVTKQNPFGAFSTTYPIIYRKGSIWLRFAQALNGAGFPGYAFAILRHGLIGTPNWVPTSLNDYMVESYKYYDPTLLANADTTFYTDLGQFYHDCLEAGLDTLETEADSTAFIDLHTAMLPNTYSQIPRGGLVPCDYISRREMEKAKTTPFLSFENYLRGANGAPEYISVQTGITEYSLYFTTNFLFSGPVASGIHQRGCGALRVFEESSTYNYVDQINKMLRLYEGQQEDLSIQEIYDPENLRTVQMAIADLIVDEMALETAFEGNRFFDLLCYSRFVGGQKGVDRVARRIAERSGSLNSSLYSHLQNPQNWYFKLP